MREKGEHHAFAARCTTGIDKFFQDAPVAFMHTIESAQGNNRFCRGGKLLYGIKDFQTESLCQANLTICVQIVVIKAFFLKV